MNVDVLRYAAFTADPASGNPAGGVPDAGQLTERDMLGIAARVGYSETAFITKSDNQLRRYTHALAEHEGELEGYNRLANRYQVLRDKLIRHLPTDPFETITPWEWGWFDVLSDYPGGSPIRA